VSHDEHPREGKGTDLILYDGVCGLCNWSVRFVLKRDRKGGFRFAPLQSFAGREILTRHRIQPDALDTFYVVRDLGLASERLLSKSSAAICVAVKLGGFWKLTTLLRVLPHHIRDFIYDTIARHRYRIFGRYDTCPLPEAGYRDRFIGPGKTGGG
jgi:predicted DCC family thiol-disulfide oxidoreductase YuxK